MLVRCLIGAYAGEVREYPSHIARQMLADGRAERIDHEPETAALAPPENAAVRTGRLAPRDIGGGWYEVAGEKVRGREAALRRAEGLEAEGS